MHRFLPVILVALISVSGVFARAVTENNFFLAQTAASALAVGTDTQAPPPQPKKDTEGPKWTDVAGTVATVIATFLAALSALLSWLTGKQAETTAKAQRLSHLWNDIQSLQYLTELEKTKLDDPAVAEIVRHNVNTMGKIGLWWTTKLIDHDVTAKEMAESYVILYNQIKKLGTFVSLQRSGMELLKENPQAIKLYEALKAYVKPETVQAAEGQP